MWIDPATWPRQLPWNEVTTHADLQPRLDLQPTLDLFTPRHLLWNKMGVADVAAPGVAAPGVAAPDFDISPIPVT